MALINYNKKATCNPISSACVYWDEPYTGIIAEDDLPCNASIGEVATMIADKLQLLKDEFDLATYNAGALDFDKTTQKIKDLLQELTNDVNTLNVTAITLQSQIDALKTGEGIELEVDLGCLANEINNCETPPTYSLLSLIELFKDQICLLKS